MRPEGMLCWRPLFPDALSPAHIERTGGLVPCRGPGVHHSVLFLSGFLPFCVFACSTCPCAYVWVQFHLIHGGRVSQTQCLLLRLISLASLPDGSHALFLQGWDFRLAATYPPGFWEPELRSSWLGCRPMTAESSPKPLPMNLCP